MTHQRVDFFLLAMDQLVNGAAKWHYMFGGQHTVPITIRLIIGRGWGQGATHSQSLQAWFAHIPGLKVIMPTTPKDAKSLLYSSILEPNPVVFLEHRWLHNAVGDIPDQASIVPLDKARMVYRGGDITVVSMSYLTIEAQHAVEYLSLKGVSVELIDLVSIKPIDWGVIFKSVEKTGRLLVLDTGFTTGSVAGEIIARTVMERMNFLQVPPRRLAMPDVPEPTSFSLTKGFYVRSRDIAASVLSMMGREEDCGTHDLLDPNPHDIPGEWFQGPF